MVQALTENNITHPTEIQQKAIPILLQGQRDFIGLAQTGTGKTAAFGLPLLHHINTKQQYVQALVLSPTRELGQQIAHQLALFAKYLPQLAIRAMYGGVPLEPQVRALKKPTHIVVATPGRLIDLVARQAVDLSHVTHLIVDEADEMLNRGFQPAINQILSFLPHEKAVWLFSATIPQEIKQLVHKYMAKDHVQVRVSPENVVNQNIAHQYMVCPPDAKPSILQTFLSADKHQQGIIFCRTKAATQRLAPRLARSGLCVDALHGDLSQSRRDKVMKRFKGRQLQALIATDVAARGIDVKDLQYVIHYNLPEQLEYYTHRSGRTARAGKQGRSLCLATPQEVKKVKQIARALGLQFQQLEGMSREGIDKRRLLEWVKKVMAASPSSANPALVQLAEEGFEGLSKQALITKLVAHLMG